MKDEIKNERGDSRLGPVERPVRRSPYHFTHHAPEIEMDGCPGCEIERLEWFILRNCDPGDMRESDAEIFWRLHKMRFPENWRNDA